MEETKECLHEGEFITDGDNMICKECGKILTPKPIDL